MEENKTLRVHPAEQGLWDRIYEDSLVRKGAEFAATVADDVVRERRIRVMGSEAVWNGESWETVGE